jgi:hypothetical protein
LPSKVNKRAEMASISWISYLLQLSTMAAVDPSCDFPPTPPLTAHDDMFPSTAQATLHDLTVEANDSISISPPDPVNVPLPPSPQLSKTTLPSRRPQGWVSFASISSVPQSPSSRHTTPLPGVLAQTPGSRVVSRQMPLSVTGRRVSGAMQYALTPGESASQVTESSSRLSTLRDTHVDGYEDVGTDMDEQILSEEHNENGSMIKLRMKFGCPTFELSYPPSSQTSSTNRVHLASLVHQNRST